MLGLGGTAPHGCMFWVAIVSFPPNKLFFGFLLEGYPAGFLCEVHACVISDCTVRVRRPLFSWCDFIRVSRMIGYLYWTTLSFGNHIPGCVQVAFIYMSFKAACRLNAEVNFKNPAWFLWRPAFKTLPSRAVEMLSICMRRYFKNHPKAPNHWS